MHTQTQYLTLEDILELHQTQIDLYGGSHGIRDRHILESALFRPQATYGGEDLYPTLTSKAAVLTHSIILNYPFIDGNKRTGILSGIAFLRLNNTEVHKKRGELVEAALAIATKKWGLEDIEKWLM